MCDWCGVIPERETFSQDFSKEQLMEVEDDSVPADIPEQGQEPNNIPEPTDEEQNGSLVFNVQG